MKHFLDWLKQIFSPPLQTDPLLPPLIRSLADTKERELTCDEVHALLDQFAEAVRRGEDAARLMPLIQAHLDMCPDCREEYETLLHMMSVPD
ncbi:MAG: hypothetical protein AABZ00_12835 [Chloroflexota bacterium]